MDYGGQECSHSCCCRHICIFDAQVGFLACQQQADYISPDEQRQKKVPLDSVTKKPLPRTPPQTGLIHTTALIKKMFMAFYAILRGAGGIAASKGRHRNERPLSCSTARISQNTGEPYGCLGDRWFLRESHCPISGLMFLCIRFSMKHLSAHLPPGTRSPRKRTQDLSEI